MSHLTKYVRAGGFWSGRGGQALLRLLAAGAGSFMALSALAPATTAAAASYPRTPYALQDVGGDSVSGHFVWYNRSVGVGGTLYSVSSCVAVVYTGYSLPGGDTGGGRILARQTRPGDKDYLCSGSLGHGFTLDASSVTGGIQSVEVNLWVADNASGGGAYITASEICDRTLNGDPGICYPHP
jgi:hypothetical protein